MHTFLADTPQLPEWILPTVLWLVGGSLAGLMGLWGAFLSFPPELIVESVVDVSKEFNSASRLKIKNTGKLPAIDISATTSNVRMQFMGIDASGNTFPTPRVVISKLTGGESAELLIPEVTKILLPANAILDEFSYDLKITFSTRLIFFSTSFKKTWEVRLHQRPDGFSWLVKNT
jgi:hypothetical protein